MGRTFKFMESSIHHENDFANALFILVIYNVLHVLTIETIASSNPQLQSFESNCKFRSLGSEI